MQPRTAFKTYQAAAASNVVIATGRCVLHRIIIGADVASGDITVGDHPSVAATNVRMKLTNSTMMTATAGCVEVGAIFDNGICVTLTNQTQVTFVWEPV